MPGANKGFGCPATKKIFFRSNSCQEFLLTTLFQSFHKIYPDFSCYFRKLPSENSDDIFQSFLPISTFSFSFFLNILPDAHLILDARGRSSLLHFLRIYPYFFDIYLCIYSENSVVGFPGWMLGAVAPPHPFCTPLHWNVFDLLLI